MARNVYDWKWVDLHDRLRYRRLPPAVARPEDVGRLGYCVVAVRDTPAGRYAIAVRHGWYWFARYDRRDPARVRIAKTGIPYGGDDDETVEPTPR